MSGDLLAVRRALLAGGVVVVPTDTVYGLAAALDVPAGVAALYALKGRPRSQPSQVLLLGSALLDEAMAALDPLTRAAAAALLPGPVTCLVPDPAGRYAAAAGAAPGTVGLRAPVPGPLAGLGLPLVATSANETGGPDPARLEEVPVGLLRGAAATFDGGPLPGAASAVVDLRALASGGAATLVRPGPDPASVARALAGAGARLDVVAGVYPRSSSTPEPGSGA